MRQDSLLDKLRDHGEQGPYPFHMPGHKRNPPRPDGLPWKLDITEIDGFDDLHQAEGLLARGMERAARLWGSKRAFYLVGGSSCGILAGIRAAAPHGSKVLVGRNCHRSVFHALELADLRPVYLTPPALPSPGIWGSLPPRLVEEALDREPEIRLVILTSPTYEGVISDIASIAAICHRRGIPLLVDEAHGAHLGFSPFFGPGAVAAGADLVIQSLHKTLPSLTQTALAHLQGDLVSPGELARQLAIFQTSSPSYPLMASIDSCVRLLEEDAPALFARWEERLAAFYRQMSGLRHLRVLDGADPLIFARDPGKILISAGDTGRTGPWLMETLRRRFSLELEMAQGSCALAMTGLWDSREGMDRLAAALLELDGELSSVPGENLLPALPPAPPQVMTIARALSLPGKTVPLSQSVGLVSREYVWAYPPGVPVLTPGEEITPALLDCLRLWEEKGIRPRSTTGSLPHGLETVERSPLTAKEGN